MPTSPVFTDEDYALLIKALDEVVGSRNGWLQAAPPQIPTRTLVEQDRDKLGALRDRLFDLQTTQTE